MRMDGEGDAGIILGNILCILSRYFSCEVTNPLAMVRSKADSTRDR